MARGARADGDAHRFGGDWTTTKLDIIGKYLAAYTTALKNQPFRKSYIDAFAGTGSRQPARTQELGELPEPLFASESEGKEAETLLDGSARIALKTRPPFDRFVFIERSEKRCAELES